MARRVGFKDAQAGGRRDHHSNSTADADEAAPNAGGFRWFLIGFLTIWLAGWTAGIVFAFAGYAEAAAKDMFLGVFLFVWIVFALAGWVFVVRILVRLLRGQPLPAATSR